MKRLKKYSLVLSAVVLVLSGYNASVQAEEKNTVIKILHTNDSHSRVFEEEMDGMGFAKLSTLVKQQEAENANTLLLDAGDTLHGKTFATLEQGASITKVMNKVGYDAMAAGNHDFNYGYQRLLELSEMVEFPILSANVINEKTGELILPPYVIKEVDGVKLGIFGLSTPETHYKTHPKNVEGLKFTDPVEAAQKMVTELTALGVDAIIAVTHLGTDESSTDTSIKVAKEAPGIDLIVDGHSHTLDNIGENGTLIVSAGEYLKNLGVVELVFEGDKLVSKKADRITKEQTAEIEADAEVQSVIDAIEASQKTILDEVVGQTAVKLDGERDQVRTGETNLGNVITNAMLHVTGADVALTNGGGIRASIETGDITKGEIITVLPFGNYIVTKEVSGADLKAALENGVSDYPKSKGAFPHVAGMTFVIDASKPAGQKVESLQINGTPVDLKKKYVLATNDFMAAGGDEYTMFADDPIKNEYPALDEVVISYIKEIGTVAVQVENRITAKAVPVEVAPEPEAPVKVTPIVPAPVKVETPVKTAPVQSQVTTYKVQQGDWLSKIAKKYQVTWQELQKVNKLKNPHKIYPGQEILIPKK